MGTTSFVPCLYTAATLRHHELNDRIRRCAGLCLRKPGSTWPCRSSRPIPRLRHHPESPFGRQLRLLHPRSPCLRCEHPSHRPPHRPRRRLLPPGNPNCQVHHQCCDPPDSPVRSCCPAVLYPRCPSLPICRWTHRRRCSPSCCRCCRRGLIDSFFSQDSDVNNISFHDFSLFQSPQNNVLISFSPPLNRPILAWAYIFCRPFGVACGDRA